MKRWLYIALFLSAGFVSESSGQEKLQTSIQGYMVPTIVYNGDTIPHITLRTVYVYPKLKFKNRRQERYYYKLVRDVKKTLPIAKEVRNAVIETYEYLETLPDEEAKQKHVKAVENFSQGKLLIKLVNRECNQSSFQLVRAFMGPFKAGFYQTFAALFGASLKKGYHPEDEDKMIERVATLVENGQL